MRHHTVSHTIAIRISRNACLTMRFSARNTPTPAICKPHFLSAPPCKAFFSTRRQRAIKSVAPCPIIGAEATLSASVAGDTRKYTYSPLITGRYVHCVNCSDHWGLSPLLAERTSQNIIYSTYTIVMIVYPNLNPSYCQYIVAQKRLCRLPKLYNYQSP